MTPLWKPFWRHSYVLILIVGDEQMLNVQQIIQQPAATTFLLVDEQVPAIPVNSTNDDKQEIIDAIVEEPDFKCTICNVGFYTREQLIEHEMQHPEIEKFTCNECNRQFRYLYHLKFHLKMHEKPKNKTHFCKKCDKSFTCRKTLYRHMDKNHLETKPYACKVCPRR